ncbi:MAG: hypothetical protein FJX67_18555, partial [Alphaproteobacteria bacterium]|nr:hypothetical protein [Alphaproteobacteria bacterium]
MTEPGGMIETVEIAVPGGSLRAPLARPARDSGPGVVVLGDPALPDGYAASVAGALGAEGHVALALTPASGVAPA